MRTALTAFVSVVSFCALAPVASAQTLPSGYAPFGTVGSIVAAPFGAAGTIVAAPFGTFGAGTTIAAPFDAAGTIVSAPFGTLRPGTPVAYGAGTPVVGGMTNPAATGTPIYSYESHVPPQPGAVGSCDLISGNRVCIP